MSEQEAKDFAELKIRSGEIRSAAFYGMRDTMRLSDEELSHTGHKTREAAVVAIYESAQRRIDALTKEYLKKYPDEGIRRPK